ncbi:AcrR family transcriptional regulator [Diaminobutyricimonas aerilata]|uniref:AcrR family transcriptional regulator n=1 Tax=Diaminobutyricimonas aerilata TaxID=1162967 RepID=A0A2M9CIS5_9MICO|nr:TetR/AcrR family transcriptional regulator [Diaminobutyricimonas aerilata]PJJ71768.1 AcrR family transcriptional regulator [Diaminobutyricimonas aerilata]
MFDQNSPAQIRTEPVQQRSAERITLLLDAAAALIAESGIDGLTTSDVAAKSESSVGVVYRYFPNIQSLLRALAGRNLQRYTERLFERVDAVDDWRAAFDLAIDVYIELNHTEPGFRAVRFGDVIDERVLQPEFDNNGVLARAFAGILVERYGLEFSDDLVFELEVLVAIADALLHRAFLVNKDGDPRFIEATRRIVHEQAAKTTALGGT